MKKKVNLLSIIIISSLLLLVIGCVENYTEIPPAIANESSIEIPEEGLQIAIKDPGMPEVKYLQPTITEIQLQNTGGEWLTIWISPEGQAVKLTSDGAEINLSTVNVTAGNYTGTRIKVSTIDVEVDVNRDGDTEDKNVQVVLTLDEFNKLPEQEKPAAPTKPSAPSSPGTPSAPDKPSQPTQPSPPSPPSPPSKPSKPSPTGDATMDGDKPEKPSEPEKPPEPEQPEQPPMPSKPEEPDEPSGASGEQPTAPYTIVGNLVYMPVYIDETHTATINDYMTPLGENMWETDFAYSGHGGKLTIDFSLHPTAIKGKQITVNSSIENTPQKAAAKAVCRGTCAGATSSCPSGMWSRGTTGCDPIKNCYKCGAWKTCCYTTPLKCCEPIVRSALKEFTVLPSTVINFDSTKGVVTLDGNAGVGGQTVSLSVPKNSPVTIPDKVVVNQGSNSNSFMIRTTGVNAPANVTITATLDNVVKTAQMTVNPTPKITITGITLSPSTAPVKSGRTVTVTGTVSLSGTSTVNQVVKLSATPSTYFSVPFAVTVPLRQKQAIFTLKLSKPVNSTVNVNVTAKLDDSSKSATLTIIR